MERRLVTRRATGAAATAFKNPAAGYRRPPVTSFTEACEAPVAMWHGAVPLRKTVTTKSDGTRFVGLEKTYRHPPEVQPRDLGFSNINGMYCLSNDELVNHFAEGVAGKVMQLFPPTHPRGFLYRKQSHLLNTFIDKVPLYQHKSQALRSLTAGRPGFVIDGATGTGKSALATQAVHYARSRGIFTLFVPNARDWTHGEWAWPSTIVPGFWDAPDASRFLMQYVARSQRKILSEWPLKVTPKLPCEANESTPKTMLQLCEWVNAVPAPSSVDRQSVGIKYFMDEIIADRTRPMVIVIDGINLFMGDTHFRFPHPDFYRTMHAWGDSDVDTRPQELPRIPAARFTFVRALNKMMLQPSGNQFFITTTTRDFKPFAGVSGFADPEKDAFANSLDEYAPFDAEKDTILHAMQVGNFDEYEYRSFLRFVVNSGELAGLGWGPLWHYSPEFERKLYKIEFMSERNPQKVIDHYHQELVWKAEYGRIRQKQALQQSVTA